MLKLLKNAKIYLYTPTEFNKLEINKIKSVYPEKRQQSKGITFAAQYGGTYHTFMDAGFTESVAKEIEKNYHKLYIASTGWKEKHIKRACKIGYVPLAFGGRLRTPVLSQVVYGDNMPYKAQEEKRTAANALIQSYGQLTNRAANEFLDRVYKSEYKYDIKMCGQIHDAIYLLIKDNLGCVKWVNDNLIDCMKWDNLPELKHDTVKLGAEMNIHYPNWANEITIPNGSTKQEILDLCKVTQVNSYLK